MAIDISSNCYAPPVPIRVLVEHHGRWYRGALRSTVSAPDGTLTHRVRWRLPGGTVRINRFPPSRVREVD